MELIIFAIIGAAIIMKAAGGAAVDWAATKTGNTPPSHDRWEKRQARRAARGEARENTPGYFRRRMRMAGEAAAVRMEQKHAARMERQRDNGRANVDKYKRRIEAREAAINRICKWGGTTLGAIRDLPETMRELQAHKENQLRDADSEAQIAAAREDAAQLPDRAATAGTQTGNVVQFRRPGSSDADQPGDAAPAAEMTEAQQLLAQRIQNHWSQGKEVDGFSDEDWFSLPLGVRGELLKVRAATHLPINPRFDPDARRQAGLKVEPEFDPEYQDRIEAALEAAPPTDAADNPGAGGMELRMLRPDLADLADRIPEGMRLPLDFQELAQYADEHPEAARAAELACQKPNARNAIVWCAAVRDARDGELASTPDTATPDIAADTTTTEGNPTVSNPTTIEITNLETASSHADEATTWANQTAASFEGTQSSLERDAASFEAQATEHENAAAALQTKGFDGDVITHENTMAEQYRLVAERLRTAAQTLTDVTESCQNAASAGSQISQIFTEQQTISENLNANRKAGVARDTAFYDA